MKRLITISIVIISLHCQAQFTKGYNPPKGWASPELYMPVVCLGSTFAINQYRMQKTLGKEKDCAIIAATGLTTSLITHFVFRKIRENKKNKYKRIIR